ncbi:MAG: XisI protein [Chthonomonadaceae bacterium]|nr:XisI protein [Chthonomonadaceae bacterium]
MENVAQYREIIHRLLEEYHAFLTELTKTDVDTEILCDDTHGQYMVMRIGWRAETRVHRPLFYLRLKDGKIHVEDDWTKEGIATELMLAGVPPSDIVLSFNPPDLRSETPAFAVA